MKERDEYYISEGGFIKIGKLKFSALKLWGIIMYDFECLKITLDLKRTWCINIVWIKGILHKSQDFKVIPIELNKTSNFLLNFEFKKELDA